MAAEHLALEEVRLQYFKGFIKEQTLPIRGRHLFLLGKNGSGKSSVIEAIRWGLFGSEGKETVSNREVVGDCRVVLGFSRRGIRYTLTRALQASGQSPGVLKDAEGRVQNLTDVIPSLQPVQAGEAAHLIYSGQNASVRVAVGDLNPYERVIYRKLGLEDIRMTIDFLQSFDTKYLCPSIDSFGKDLDKKDAEAAQKRGFLQEKINAVLKDRPWGTNQLPTTCDTEAKIKTFISDLRAILRDSTEPPAELQLSALLQVAKMAVTDVETPDADKLRDVAEATRTQLLQARDLLNRIEKQATSLDVETQARDEARSTLEQILAGLTIADLELELQKEVAAGSNAERYDVLFASALSLEEQFKDECPVCGTKVSREVIHAHLSQASSDSTSHLGNLTRKRTQLHERIESAKANQGRVAGHDREISRLLALGEHLGVELRGLLGKSQESDTVALLRERITALETELAKQIEARDSSAKKVQEWKLILTRLEQEIRYHELRKQLAGLRSREEAIQATQEHYKSLVAFQSVCNKIALELGNALRNGLRQSLPSLAEEFTLTFMALTQHPSYKHVLISDAAWPKLELRVATDNVPEKGRVPKEVLNGQASNALAIVPYFVLSGAPDAQIEVHTVMLDDPTQSFDETHIDFLVKRLATLGEQVQLVVASEHVNVFKEAIKQHFASQPYVVAEFDKHVLSEGPSFSLTCSVP